MNSKGTGSTDIVEYCIISRELVEINGDSGVVEEIHSPRGETLPLVQLETSGIAVGDALFLQAEEKIGIRTTVHVMRGDVVPIVQE